MQRFLSCMWSSSMTLVIQSFSGLYVFKNWWWQWSNAGIADFFFFFPVKSQIETTLGFID